MASPLLLALLIGVVAGLRSMVTPAAVAWAAVLGWISLAGTALAFAGSIWTAGIMTVLAAGELVADKLPSTPSRKVPMQFGTRVIMGGLCGAAIGAMAGLSMPGVAAGIVGAAIGTAGGSAARGWLAARFGHDLPAALIEDAVAIGGALLIMASLR